MQQVQTQDLLKFLGKDHTLLVLSWLDTILKQQQLALNTAIGAEMMTREQGKVQMLSTLMLGINGCITASR